MKVTARTKLAEMPIVWKEAYTDKTQRLKEMYDEVVGAGSYFRFEGTNSETGDEYYVIVGPAKVNSPKAEFFAGVRKLPSDFAAGGKYFSEMREAITYASETWGVDIPSSISYFDAGDLKDIKSKVKDWRDAHEWKEDAAEDDEDDNVGDESDKEAFMTKDDYVYVESSTFPFYRKVVTGETKVAISTSHIRKFSMGAPARMGRTGYKWYDLDHASLGSDPEFEKDKEQWPALEKAFQQAWKQRQRFRNLIASTYGTENLNSEFYHVWLSFSEEFGAYIVSVGPYFEYNKDTQEYTPSDRFDAFWKRLNVFSQEFLDKKTADLLEGYSSKYGITLAPEDYIPPQQGGLIPEFKLTPSGRAKVYEAVKEYYGVDASTPQGKGLKNQLIDAYKAAYPKWKAQLDAAYAKSQENGDAFLKSQPPPPDIRWMKPRPIGQQMNTSAHLADEEEGSSKGFTTLKEAIDFVNSKSWAGCPMLEGYDNVTGEELAEARQKHDTQKVQEEKAQPPQPGKQPATKTPVKQPARKVEDNVEVPVGLMDSLMGEEADVESDTINKLVALSESLDKDGKHVEAEEVHKILRKHAGKFVWADGEVKAKFRNFYKCPCGEKWQDEWDSMCNDKCPKCNKEIEPYRSEDID